MEAKGNIRKEVFARRRAATQEEIQEKSRMIYEKITALPEFLDADCFFAYMDFKKEVMTRDLIEKALQMGKTVAVLPSGDTLRCKLFPADKFYKSSLYFEGRIKYNEVNEKSGVGGIHYEKDYNRNALHCAGSSLCRMRKERRYIKSGN